MNAPPQRSRCQAAAYSTSGFEGSIARSTNPVVSSTNRVLRHVLPPSLVRKTPRSGFGPQRWPSAATGRPGHGEGGHPAAVGGGPEVAVGEGVEETGERVFRRRRVGGGDRPLRVERGSRQEGGHDQRHRASDRGHEARRL